MNGLLILGFLLLSLAAHRVLTKPFPRISIKSVFSPIKCFRKCFPICLRRKIKLIIENPYSEVHYLTRYWPIKPSYIDYDRSQTGDFEKKPTQFYFINCEPKFNFIFEATHIKTKYTHNSLWWKKNYTVVRSMISPDYANRFIREFIL